MATRYSSDVEQEMKTIVITGASRGFGYEITNTALAYGYTVIAIARSRGFASLFEGKYKNHLHSITGSVGDSNTGVELAKKIDSVDGRLQALVNNAGTPGSGAYFENSKTSDILDEVSVHCAGALQCSQICATRLIKSKGAIVNITSRLGSMGRTAKGDFKDMNLSYSYRIAKAAQNMLSLCLSDGPKLSGVTVCGLHPGRLKTGCGMQDAPTEATDAAQKFIDWLEAMDHSRHRRCFDLYGKEMEW